MTQGGNNLNLLCADLGNQAALIGKLPAHTAQLLHSSLNGLATLQQVLLEGKLLLQGLLF